MFFISIVSTMFCKINNITLEVDKVALNEKSKLNYQSILLDANVYNRNSNRKAELQKKCNVRFMFNFNY
ncbi:hypothetical protein BpHYR1_043274 [Brachionus plicatilis]|uniref:Uncharacterized protein n=1 Tax=Brachionus plicatilis TaxID=10195 RepID=A0A3M7STU3_BRAPC|nr:hypothetical protein BpHYR1_043274 [Brachionus plicatilis]